MSGPKKPTKLGDALQNYLRDSGLDERVEEAAIVPEWAERVGEAIAAVTTPLRTSRLISNPISREIRSNLTR